MMYNDRIANDLEKAQEKRFNAAAKKYTFFDDIVEINIKRHILNLRKQLARDLACKH